MKRMRNMLRFDSIQIFSNRAARAAKPSSRRLRVEQLEDRAMLSGVSLLGDADALSSGAHLVEPPTIAEGDSLTVIGPHHAEPGHGTPTHFFAETGDDHHFAWQDQDLSTPDVIDIYYDFRDVPGRWGANQITDGQKDMAVLALNKWALATGGKIQFTLMETGSRDNIIDIGTGNLKALHPSFGSGPGGILGLGGGTYTHDSGHAITGGIAWMDSAEDWINDFDYFTVVAQEIGHALGLGHSQDLGGTNIMNGTYTGAIAEYSTNDSDHIPSVYGESGPVNEMPTVIISSPTDGFMFDTSASVSFAGTASDTEDGDLTAGLVWTSSIDGEIGTGGSFSITLSDGNHTITAEVTDSGGKTGSFSISIIVGDSPVETDIASVASITYATEGGKTMINIFWTRLPLLMIWVIQ